MLRGLLAGIRLEGCRTRLDACTTPEFSRSIQPYVTLPSIRHMHHNLHVPYLLFPERAMTRERSHWDSVEAAIYVCIPTVGMIVIEGRRMRRAQTDYGPTGGSRPSPSFPILGNNTSCFLNPAETPTRASCSHKTRPPTLQRSNFWYCNSRATLYHRAEFTDSRGRRSRASQSRAGGAQNLPNISIQSRVPQDHSSSSAPL